MLKIISNSEHIRLWHKRAKMIIIQSKLPEVQSAINSLPFQNVLLDHEKVQSQIVKKKQKDINKINDVNNFERWCHFWSIGNYFCNGSDEKAIALSMDNMLARREIGASKRFIFMLLTTMGIRLPKREDIIHLYLKGKGKGNYCRNNWQRIFWYRNMGCW